ncbi:MAG: glycosyltransferase family 39 protein [bacterium]|nr:glycosyltransferase family 39 protein [bacterium]
MDSNDNTAVSGYKKIMVSVPFWLGVVMVLIQMLTAGNYGIFGDELYYVDCAKRLAFGYVDHPPIVALVARISLFIFGQSLIGLRLFAAMAGFGTILLAAGIARQLGGGRFAQSLASVLVVVSIAYLAIFNFFSMNAFDVLISTLLFYLLLKIINGAPAKTWLWFGLVAGIGVMNKYTILVLGFSIVVGLVATKERKHLATPWPYMAAVIVFFMFLPHILWQISHGWPTLEFMHNAQQFKNNPITIPAFFGQLILSLNPVTLPLWLGGVVFLFAAGAKDSQTGKEQSYRSLGIMLAVFFAVYLAHTPKVYYVFPVMVLAMAAGAVAWERVARRFGGKKLQIAILVLMILSGTVLMPLAVPILPIGDLIPYSRAIGLLQEVKMQRNENENIPVYFVSRFGWKELVKEVARVYDTLPQQERKACMIYGSWYGIAGAVNFYGPEYGLPNAVSSRNNYWLWGPGDTEGEIVLAVGESRDRLKEIFNSVEKAGESNHPYTYNYTIYICRDPKYPIDKIWQRLKNFI